MDAGFELKFKESWMDIISLHGKTISHRDKISKLYSLDIIAPEITQAHATKPAQSWQKSHKILGHLYMGSVKRLFKKKMVKGMDIDKLPKPQKDCEACIQAKHHTEPFPHEAERSYAEIGEMIFLDLWELA